MPDGAAPSLREVDPDELWDDETVDAFAVLIARTLARRHHDAEERARREAGPCE
ncbi:hypothetical protein [Thalassobaculum sp.]|uniref:hypothetical protein n=1 Tax=Thalassobaculum sp. TaxID=2022740 RepID=UPI0032EB7904